MLLFWIIAILALAAVGVAALARRSGKGFSQQLGDMGKALGFGGNGSTTSHADATKAELYEAAKDAEIPGRSTMTKDELKSALDDES